MAENNFTITDEEEIILRAKNPGTQGGKPATLDSPVTWTVLSGDCTLTPVDDISIKVTSGAANVTNDISASADADLGEGVTTITDLNHVHVLAAMAAHLGIEADPPTLKPMP